MVDNLHTAVFRRNALRFLIFFGWLVFPFFAWAGDCTIEKIDALPITYIGQLPTVPVEINDHIAQMIVDTGAEKSVLFSSTEIGMKLFDVTRQKMSVMGADGRRTYVNGTVIGNFVFAGQNYKDLEMPVVDPTVPLLHQKINEYNKNLAVAGILGADLLSRYDLDLDFPHRSLGLYYVKDCSDVKPAWAQPAVSLPVKFIDKKRFALQIEVNGYPVDALFDTGSNGNVVRLSSAGSLGVTDDEIKADRLIVGSSIGASTSEEQVQKFKELKIGNERFLNKNMVLLELPKGDFQMLLGEAYMAFRHFWVSYSTSALFIQAGR